LPNDCSEDDTSMPICVRDLQPDEDIRCERSASPGHSLPSFGHGGLLPW